jgi:predicted RNA binding protein YcfA (HicA-like mRNA interferase family)
MTSSELLRKLRRLGAEVISDRGKGGHVMVVLDGRRTFVPTGSGELKRGLVAGVLKALGVKPEDLR